MKLLVIFLFCGPALGSEVEDASNKVMVDWILNLQMTNLDNALRQLKKTVVDLGDHSLQGGIIAKGVKLGDLSTLVRTDHAYLWTSPGNTIQSDAFVGLGNMTVSVDSLSYKGQTFPATFTVGVNSLGFHQNLTMEETSCQETYSKIAFYKLDKVTIFSDVPDYNNQDVSEFVKMSVLPYVNGLMQQKPFMNLVQTYLDVCNGGLNRLNHLILS